MLTPLFCELSIKTNKQTCWLFCFSGQNLVKTHPCAVLTSQILVTMTRDFHSSILEMHNFVMIRILMPQIRIGLGRGAGTYGDKGGFSPPSFDRISNFALSHSYAPKVILNVLLNFRVGRHQILRSSDTPV